MYHRNLDKDFGCVRAELPENGNLQLPILKVTGKKSHTMHTSYGYITAHLYTQSF